MPRRFHHGVHDELGAGSVRERRRADERQVALRDRLQTAEAHLLMPVDPVTIALQVPRRAGEIPAQADDQRLADSQPHPAQPLPGRQPGQGRRVGCQRQLEPARECERKDQRGQDREVVEGDQPALVGDGKQPARQAVSRWGHHEQARRDHAREHAQVQRERPRLRGCRKSAAPPPERDGREERQTDGCARAGRHLRVGGKDRARAGHAHDQRDGDARDEPGRDGQHRKEPLCGPWLRLLGE